MEHEKFIKLLDKTIEDIRNVLNKKNAEYSSGKDKLHNFKRAAKMLQCSPEKALIGMLTKHIISILDIVDEIDFNCGEHSNALPSFDKPMEYIEKVNEKITDALNYLILLKALIYERYRLILSDDDIND